MIFDSIKRWNNFQKNKEDIGRLKLNQINSELDFDIVEVSAERDIDWEPTEILNGEPVDFVEVPFVRYKVKLVVYNPCIIENVIRSVDIEVINRNKKENTKINSSEDKNSVPTSIPARTHKELIFYKGIRGWMEKKEIS